MGYCNGGFRGGGGFNSMDPKRVRQILGKSTSHPITTNQTETAEKPQKTTTTNNVNKTKNNVNKTKNKGSSIRRTTDLKRPLTKSGKPDKRFKNPEFCNKDGTRDKRCTQTAKR
jgi:hypothetical protein